MAIQETRNKAPTTAPSPPANDKASGPPAHGIAPPRPPRRDLVALTPAQAPALPQRQVATAPSPRPRKGGATPPDVAPQAFGPKHLQQAVKSGEHLAAFKEFGAKDLQRAVKHDTKPDLVGDPSITQPISNPRTTMNGPVLPQARLADLPLAPHHEQQVQAKLKELSAALGKGQQDVAKARLDELVALWRAPLDSVNTSGPVKLAFTLSDGQAFVQDVKQQLLAKTSLFSKSGVQHALDGWADQKLHAAFDQLVSGVLDKAVATDDKAAPKRIEVDGRTYQRADDKAMASGHYGQVWRFVNIHDPNDQVVLKVPTNGGGKQDRDARFFDPIREGVNTVQAMGTGASPNMTRLVGVLRTTQEVQLVFRYEPGGSLKGALDKLDRQPSPELAQGKLLLMKDLIDGARHLGEGQALTHSDLAARNVLVNADGRAVIADFGMAASLPPGTAPGQGSVSLGGAQLPVRWAAPEALLTGDASPKADVFSLGVVFVEMALSLSHSTPFWSLSQNDAVVQAKVGNWDPATLVGDIPANLWPGVDVVALKALIVRMLDADPAKRPSLDEVRNSPVFARIEGRHREAVVQALKPVVSVPQQPGDSSGDFYAVTNE